MSFESTYQTASTSSSPAVSASCVQSVSIDEKPNGQKGDKTALVVGAGFGGLLGLGLICLGVWLVLWCKGQRKLEERKTYELQGKGTSERRRVCMD
jgi:hypothetical protein